jgi:hypothetical protein
VIDRCQGTGEPAYFDHGFGGVEEGMHVAGRTEEQPVTRLRRVALAVFDVWCWVAALFIAVLRYELDLR